MNCVVAHHPSIWPVHHRSVTYQGVCLLHRTGSPADYCSGLCEEWDVLQVSLEAFNKSFQYTFIIDIKVPSFSGIYRFACISLFYFFTEVQFEVY